MIPLRRGHPLLLAALLALGGCSGTNFGRQLASSFDSPPQAPAPGSSATPSAAAPTGTPTPTAATTAGKTPAPPSPAPAGGADKPGAGATVASLPGKPAPEVAGAKPSPAPSKGAAPVPYRVTLKLPTADPSAPAEAVTEALRAAGIRFEVETIELIRPATAPPAAALPQATPAPALR